MAAADDEGAGETTVAAVSFPARREKKPPGCGAGEAALEADSGVTPPLGLVLLALTSQKATTSRMTSCGSVKNGKEKMGG